MIYNKDLKKKGRILKQRIPSNRRGYINSKHREKTKTNLNQLKMK